MIPLGYELLYLWHIGMVYLKGTANLFCFAVPFPLHRLEKKNSSLVQIIHVFYQQEFVWFLLSKLNFNPLVNAWFIGSDPILYSSLLYKSILSFSHSLFSISLSLLSLALFLSSPSVLASHFHSHISWSINLQSFSVIHIKNSSLPCKPPPDKCTSWNKTLLIHSSLFLLYS